VLGEIFSFWGVFTLPPVSAKDFLVAAALSPPWDADHDPFFPFLPLSQMTQSCRSFHRRSIGCDSPQLGINTPHQGKISLFAPLFPDTAVFSVVSVTSSIGEGSPLHYSVPRFGRVKPLFVPPRIFPKVSETLVTFVHFVGHLSPQTQLSFLIYTCSP